MEHFTVNPLQSRAMSMANRLCAAGQPLAAIPINIVVMIINTMVQAIMQCKLPDPTPTPSQNIKDYVTKRYNPDTGQYDRYLLKRMDRQAKHAGKAHEQRLDQTQQRALSLESLDEARQGHTETMAAIDQVVADDPHNSD